MPTRHKLGRKLARAAKAKKELTAQRKRRRNKAMRMLKLEKAAEQK